jgi:hypothetical protein
MAGKLEKLYAQINVILYPNNLVPRVFAPQEESPWVRGWYPKGATLNLDEYNKMLVQY